MMELLLNDLSLHGQFPDLTAFRKALQLVMSLRSVASGFGHQLHSHRNILNGRVNPTMSLHEALQALSKDEKRSILQWLTRKGPFWEDMAQHSPDLWMACEDEIVTETAVGEAAYCMAVGISRGLVSFSPSKWQSSLLRVKIFSDTVADVTIPNYWRIPELEAALQEAKPPIATWGQLESESRASFRRLAFSADCYSYLDGQPFAPGAAYRILVRLRTLDELVGSVDASGQRTVEGHRIYNEHFTGQKAWFSDSSETEKNEFEEKLTFLGPQGTPIFCTWHGKVNNPPFRIHFSWPVRPGDSLFVAYIGLKITRR